MDITGTFHLLFAGLALAIGASISMARKGTPRHRWTGRLYIGAMLGLNATALMHYELNGRFNVFHWLVVVSLLTIAAGWIAVRLRRHLLHARFMMWSYVGLLAASAGEIAARSPLIRDWTDFGIAVGGASLLVSIVGAVFIERAARRFSTRQLSAAVEGGSESA